MLSVISLRSLHMPTNGWLDNFFDRDFVSAANDVVADSSTPAPRAETSSSTNFFEVDGSAENCFQKTSRVMMANPVTTQEQVTFGFSVSARDFHGKICFTVTDVLYASGFGSTVGGTSTTRSLGMRAMLASLSPSSRRMMRTPWVLRPISLMSPARTR